MRRGCLGIASVGEANGVWLLCLRGLFGGMTGGFGRGRATPVATVIVLSGVAGVGEGLCRGGIGVEAGVFLGTGGTSEESPLLSVSCPWSPGVGVGAGGSDAG